MKRIILLILLAGLGFYVAWPAFSAYRLNEGLKSRDAPLVSSRIDFPMLRESLRPAVHAETEKAVDEAFKSSGGLGAQLGPQLKSQFMPKIVDHALVALVTPEILIRVYSEGGTIKDSISRIVAEQSAKLGGVPGQAGIGGLGDVLSGAFRGGNGASGGGNGASGGGNTSGGLQGLGGLFGKKKDAGASPVRTVSTDEPKAAPASEPARSVSLSNIKTFGFDGPMAIFLGVAKDPAASEPDVTVRMAFTGGDWKLVGLTPKAR